MNERRYVLEGLNHARGCQRGAMYSGEVKARKLRQASLDEV